MEWTGLNEIREQFLSFFESKAHTRLASFPLIPQDDNSLLLINSGMAPMKKWFLGQATPPNKRVTTCQKCIRTPDIERVGKTARHGTFFEMLGNFSFGDYFKHEATKWAWEFVTEVVKLPPERVWITIYEDDDEAKDIWVNEVGIDPSHIVRMGKEDNFWEIGSGPCGPCSELYFDRGEEYGCGKPTCGVGCDCDRFVEFWNLVFSQFDGDGNGNYELLEHPNIDTGMGLERLACILQGVDNLFEVDTIQNIMKHISRIAGVNYKEDDRVDVSLRVITDHVRSTTFMVADGVVPQNEGRGYVLRRLLRRAARHGRLLGINHPFLYEVVDTVIKENEGAYPELTAKRDYIKKVIRIEEEKFSSTINQGIDMLNQIIDKIQAEMEKSTEEGSALLSGEAAFKLYDTFGFPIDLTKEIIAEKAIDLDEEEFNRLMQEQKERARAARQNNDIISWAETALPDLGDEPTKFVGYGAMESESRILAILKDGELADSADAGERATIVLDVTPFYAESGGQVADVGALCADGVRVEILGCQKTPSGHYLHIAKVAEGSIRTGQEVKAAVDKATREATMRNHTAAHLLQAALREVLGEHVHQAGQLVDPHRVRFDFAHFSAMTEEELAKVEDRVNEMILAGVPVEIFETSIKEAQAMGAMALFGEKYGDTVRVVRAKDCSMELCGGTHVENTAKIGLFKIVSESSVAAGVRRIEGVTGMNVIATINHISEMMDKAASNLKLSSAGELVQKSAMLMADLKAKDRQIEALEQKLASQQVKGLFENAIDVGGARVITASFSGTTTDALRTMCDQIKDQAPKMVALLSTVNDGKATIVCACGKEAVAAGAHAGKIIKTVATMAGGNGGGRPDFAMAGGITEVFKVDEVLAKVPEIVKEMLH